MAPMELPQWLMISEGLLVVAGFIGVLVSGKKADEVDPPPDDVGVSLEAELGPRVLEFNATPVVPYWHG